MITYGSHANQIIDNGYTLTPIRKAAKNPVIKNWISPEAANPDPQKYKSCGVGVVCGTGSQPVYALDIDIKDEKIVEFVKNEIASITGADKSYRIGNAPKSLLVYRFLPGLKKRKTEVYEVGHLERLGAGQQFVAFGIHPLLKRPYSWPGSSILDMKAEELPVISEDQISNLFDAFTEYMKLCGYPLKEKKNGKSDRLYDYEDGNPLYEKKPLGLSLGEVKDLVDEIDPDCSRDEWRNVGMAVHHETEGAQEGFELWDEWSSQGTKYNEAEMEYQWESFGKYTGEPRTVRSLIHLSNKPVEEPKKDKRLFFQLDWSPQRFVDDPPPVPMVVYGMLPRGIVSLFYSAGGVGKSTLVFHLAVCIAAAGKYDVDFLGKAVEGGKVVIITAEDPEVVLNRRYIGLLNELRGKEGIDLSEVRKTVEENLSVVSTFGHSVPLFKVHPLTGILKKTVHFDALQEKLLSMEDLQLVVIDTKTRFSPGEGLGNVTATQEIAFYEELALSTGASVTLLHHSNKKSRDGSQTGAQAYRDATAIYDSVRAAWYLRGITNGEGSQFDIPAEERDRCYILENSKNNYVISHKDILIKRNGFSYEYETVIPIDDKTIQKEEKLHAAVESVVQHMQREKQVEFIQAEIIEMGKAANISRSRVITALKEAEEDGLIDCEAYGGRGKAKKYRLTPEGVKYGLTI